MTTTAHNYYSIVTFGSPTYGTRRRYYRSLACAMRDARTLGGGTLSTVRVVRAETRQQAIDADISGRLPVVYQRLTAGKPAPAP